MIAGADVQTEMLAQGRLGTYQPLLLITLPAGKTSQDCNTYTRSLPQPIDVGVYSSEFQMPENVMFVNAYNLKPEEAKFVAEGIIGYLNMI